MLGPNSSPRPMRALYVFALLLVAGCDSAGEPVGALPVSNESDRPVVVVLVSEASVPLFDPVDAISSGDFDAEAIRVGDVSAQLVFGEYRDGEALRVLVYARREAPSPRIVEVYGAGAAEPTAFQMVTARDRRRDGNRIVIRDAQGDGL